jgi:glutathione synthase
MKIAFLMDRVEKIHPKKDSSIVLMEEAFARKHEVYYFEQKDLFLKDEHVFASLKKLNVWFDIHSALTINLNELDVIFMRKDPPVDMEYIYSTMLLELLEKQGVKIINSPSGLRDVNEKLFISWFPGCCVPTVVSQQEDPLKAFVMQYKDIIIKPLNGMGGQGIFRVTENDYNINAMLETATQNYTRLVMVQKYISDIKFGDKRVILMHGEPLPYAISRLAKSGETRANLAAGGSCIPAELTERDKWICQQISPVLKQKRLSLVGIDIIGDYLTEINVTSPTCLRDINNAFNINSAAYFFDGLKL